MLSLHNSLPKNQHTYFLALGIAFHDAAELGRQSFDIKLLLLVAVPHNIVQPFQVSGSGLDFPFRRRLLVLSATQSTILN